MNLMEALILLVVLGTMLIFVVRLQRRKKSNTQEETEEIQNSTAMLRQELERSGQEIVQRMGGHVEELEHLLQEANEKISALHGELAQSQVVQKTLETQLQEAQGMIDQLQHEQRQAKEIQDSLQLQGAVLSAAIPVSAASSQQPAQAALQVQQIQQEVAAAKGQVQITADASKEDEAIAAEIARAVRNANRREISEDILADGSQLREQVRSLLIAGWSVEAVSRETGLGCSAIELMKKMLRTQMEEDLQGA